MPSTTLPRQTEPCSGRKYPVSRAWGDCTIGGDIKDTDCERFIGPGWETYMGNKNTLGDTCFPGWRSRRCVKTKWSDDNRQKCCFGELNSSRDCDPKWCPGSTDCEKAVKNYCTQNNGKNMEEPQCRNACETDPKAPWCDLAAATYCRIHKSDSDNVYCGCLNSQMPVALSCMDNYCRRPGVYISDKLENNISECIKKPVTCQNMTTCITKAGDCTVTKNEYTQQCAPTPEPPTKPPIDPPTKPPMKPPTKPPTKSPTKSPTEPATFGGIINWIKNNKFIAGGIGGVILLFIILIIVAIVARVKKTK